MSKKRIDLTGQRFGRLVALEPAKTESGASGWRCRCDCGKETVAQTGNLRSGKTKSCGCQRDRIDLTGQRFGKLVALEPAENIGRKTAWRCRCDCGRETVVETANLRSGDTKSCGCQRDRINLTGQRFGKLTVLEQTENIGTSAGWRCRCDCGKEVAVRGENLRSGNTQSCGCLRGSKRIDLTGQRFGKLTVLEQAPDIGRRTTWRCRCDCGKEVVVTTNDLRSGATKSCGCGRTFLYGSEPYLTYIDGTCVETLRSKRLPRNNTSGVRGVSWVARDQRWSARIGFKGKLYHLGCYRNFEDAVAARKKAEAEMHDKFVEEYDAAQAEEKELVGCQNVST